jgi:hypothetical protein
MLVHCFWLMDSNPGLNSMVVCSLILVWKRFGFEKGKRKKKESKQPSRAGHFWPSQQPAALCSPAAQQPAAARARGG